MTEGILDIRGPAEPAPMALPTTITGTNDGGQITAGTLSTPTVTFVQKVTSPAVTDVTIDAAFSLVSPNSLRGSIDEDRNVRLTASLKVDLTLRVQILPDKVYRCTATPVALVMEGHHDGTSVRLRAPNFSVPAVPTTADCEALIADAINEQLAGGGHSLTLDMTGELTAPLAPGEASTTALTVAPAGTVAAGAPVTLTATVVPGATATNDDTPVGVVEFRDGEVGIGQVELDDDGKAQLVTTTLQGGPRTLTAHYLGSAPIYAPSSSTATSLVVMSGPSVTVDMPSAVVAGSSIDFDVTARNSDYGAALAAGRLDIAIRRTRGGDAIGPDGATPRISVTRIDGDDEIPVALTLTGTGLSQVLQGAIDPPAGQPLPAGETRQVRLRLSVASNTPLGPLRVTVGLTDTLTDTIVAEGIAETDMIATDRHATTLTAGIPSPAPILFRPPVLPVRARVGQTVEIYQLKLSSSASSSVLPTGSYTFSIDGKPLLVRKETGAGDDQWVERAEFSGNITPVLLLPSDVGVGPRTISVSYSGDRYHAPATAAFPVTIDPPIGPSYECVHTGTFFQVARAQLEGRATLPSVGASSSVVLENTSLKLRLSRNSRAIQMVQYLQTRPISGITVEFAGGGTVTAEGVTLMNNTEMRTDDPAGVDMVATLTGVTGAADLTGPPGGAVDVAIASITINYLSGLVTSEATETIRCTPAGEVFSFGGVTVAGVDIDAPEVAAAGSEVTLSAQGHPAGPGSIEFTADGHTVGHVATTDGAGTIWTRTITATGGDVDVVATFYPSGPFPAVSSEPHRIRVITTCTPLDEGTGATVRLVYMELLGRCPDTAGYEYWTGQLDGGLSPETFAQRISASLEARKVIVADAYRLLLDRAPDSAGATFWAERLGRNARYDDLLASIAASAEFRQRAGGTDTGVVTRLYERIIGRAPDTAGRDYWVDVLRSRGITQVVRSFVNLPEPLAAIVTSSYQDLLGRAPTADERTAGVDALRATGDRSALYASIIATDDFADRAQTFPELT